MAVTIRTVAAHAGVSASTVSRVFARPEAVAETARKRVLASAAELGYRPSPVARSLALGRSGNLGLIVPDIANPFFAPLIKAVHKQSMRQSQALFVADSDEDAADEFAQARAMAKQVDGIVLASSRIPDERVREIAALVPVVLVSRAVDGVPAVLTPPTDGLEQAVEHLTALGHRRAVFLGGPADSYATVERMAALTASCEKWGMPLVRFGPYQPQFESGVRAADSIIADGSTAVVAYNDAIALGLVNRLSARGYRVGVDVSVIGIDDSWIAERSNPSLTTVRVPADKAGKAAVRLLTDLQVGAGAADTRVELPTELVIRNSTGPAS